MDTKTGSRLPDPREKPLIMGIINATPDSFWSGSRQLTEDAALRQGEKMLAEGAAILDVGGESTRPGAAPLSPDEEAARILPLIRALVTRLGAVVSVDTRRAVVARQALAAGAAVVNDVSALSDPQMGGLVAEYGAGVVLMHMQGVPETMQDAPQYGAVLTEVMAFLEERVETALAAGIGRDQIWIDPGIGFGKTLAHNLELIRGVGRLAGFGYPVVMALSRKSMIGTVTGREVGERLIGTALYNLFALQNGARILRVHDVAAAADTIAVHDSLSQES